MKNCIVYGTPQTGSKLIYALLWAYYKNRYPEDYKFLNDFFNPLHYNVFYEDVTDTQRIQYNDPGPKRYRIVPAIENTHINLVPDFNARLIDNTDIETQVRLDLLRKYRGADYLLRVEEPLNDDVFKFLNRQYIFICLERENILDQILGFALSTYMETMAQINNVSTPTPNSIYMAQNVYLEAAKRIRNYHKRKQLIRNKVIIKTEQIDSVENEYDLYNLMNIRDWNKVIKKEDLIQQLPPRMDFGDKRKYFRNLDDILLWHKSCFR
jgi:hypothetical protein